MLSVTPMLWLDGDSNNRTDVGLLMVVIKDSLKELPLKTKPLPCSCGYEADWQEVLVVDPKNNSCCQNMLITVLSHVSAKWIAVNDQVWLKLAVLAVLKAVKANVSYPVSTVCCTQSPSHPAWARTRPDFGSERSRLYQIPVQHKQQSACQAKSDLLRNSTIFLVVKCDARHTYLLQPLLALFLALWLVLVR